MNLILHRPSVEKQARRERDGAPLEGYKAGLWLSLAVGIRLGDLGPVPEELVRDAADDCEANQVTYSEAQECQADDRRGESVLGLESLGECAE